MCVQFATFEDLVFMSGIHPEIKSMIISVFNFTVVNGRIRPCDPKEFGGPFLSYIREDDDLNSLSDRLGKITGENDFSKFRLALVNNYVPHFIKKGSLSPVHINSNDVNKSSPSRFQLESKADTERSLSPSSPTETLWEKYSKSFKIFSQLPLHEALEQLKKKNKKYLPQLGVLRVQAQKENNSR